MNQTKFALAFVVICFLNGCIQPVTAEPAKVDKVAAAQQSASSPDACPVTQPPEPRFIPPPPNREYPPSGEFWYGSDALWIALPDNGQWNGLPHNLTGYTQKIFWWRKGYSWQEEPTPQLTVSGRRLDGSAPPLQVSAVTNAFAEDIQSAMLVGVDFPTVGCWEITGRYANAELSFVVWVGSE